MDPTLTRHVQPPSPRPRTLVLWAVGTATLAAALATVSIPVVLIAMSPRGLGPDREMLVVAASEPAPSGPATAVNDEQPPRLDAAHAQLSFVAHAGGRHFAILDKIATTPPFERTEGEKLAYPATAQLLGELDYPMGAVMPVDAQRELPATVAAWRGQRIAVDGVCETEIGDIVELSLLSGSPDYAIDVASNDKAAMLDYAVQFGAHYYAAELGDCRDGSWFRHGRLPAAQLAIESKASIDDAAVAKAKKHLIRSELGRDATARWKEAGHKGHWYQDNDIDASFTSKLARHPLTGERWIVLQARADYGCGGVDINLLGIYKVSGDDIEPYLVKDAGELISIDQLLDINGDGTFELIGTSYLDGPALTNDGADVQFLLEVPFYGCPC